VRVLLRGMTMSGPAGVADSVSAFERTLADQFFQVAKFAGRPPHLQAVSITGYGNARRIIASILQSPEPLKNYRDSSFGADISHDAAHIQYP